MTESVFQILGADVPNMVGRNAEMQRLLNDLTKRTPSNLSIIGPRFIGKTVIINALAERLKSEESPYKFIIRWHLGHDAPQSDEDFIKQLCDILCVELSKTGGGYEDYVDYLKDYKFTNLLEVTDLLNSDGIFFLMLWDGFDKPLGQGKLTGHLWDQMRSVFAGKGHKIVTVTRKPLSELIRSQDAITSPFWNIFDMNPIKISFLNDADRESILNSMPSHTFEPGAITELLNWSGNVPILYFTILNQIARELPKGNVDNKLVNKAASIVKESLSESSILSTIWDDCSAKAKEAFCYLIERGQIKFSDIGVEERTCLIEKGFIDKSGSNLNCSCRIKEQFVEEMKPDMGSMARLFESWENYRTNIRSLLEHRLSHISRFNERLHHLVGRAIEDIPERPDDCLNNLTHIEDIALDAIWFKECGADKRISQKILDDWKYGTRHSNPTVTRIEDEDRKIPSDRTFQCRLLQLLTGSVTGFTAHSSHVSKDTYLLINAIHSFRNRTEHTDGESIPLGVAVSALMLCIELLSCLERELK